MRDTSDNIANYEKLFSQIRVAFRASKIFLFRSEKEKICLVIGRKDILYLQVVLLEYLHLCFTEIFDFHWKPVI